MYSLTVRKPRSGVIFVFSRPMPSVSGARPTATRTFSASLTTCLPSEAVKVTFAPVLVGSTFSTLAPVLMSMPRFLKTRASSLLMSSSSAGTTRGRYSRMVTSEPKLRKMEANSTPTAPAPMTMRDLGMASMERISMLVRTGPPASTPGNRRAFDPVATTTFFALMVSDLPPPETSTEWMPPFAGPVSLPKPATTVTLFFRMRNSSPLVCLATIWLLRSRIFFQLRAPLPRPSIP